jgi:hypothetical protein
VSTEYARPSKKPVSEKGAREYGESEGAVTIWYKNRKKPDEDFFGKLVESTRLARELVDAAVTQLKVDPPTELVKQIMKSDFRIENENAIDNFLPTIREMFAIIKSGLSGQVILCVSKTLSEDDRGDTSGKTIRRIRLNASKLADDSELAIARTIVHEAAHLYAGMRGNVTKKEEGYTDMKVQKESYKDDIYYNDIKPCDTIYRPDSYAWAALSLHHGHLLDTISFHNVAGCQIPKCVN